MENYKEKALLGVLRMGNPRNSALTSECLRVECNDGHTYDFAWVQGKNFLTRSRGDHGEKTQRPFFRERA